MRRVYFGLLAVLLVGCAGNAIVDQDAPYRTSVQRMTRLSQGLQLYVGDNDDNFPPTNWMDTLAAYVPDGSDFVSPALDGQPGAFGYALNSLLPGQGRFSFSDDVLALFDSTATSRNAVASINSLPNPPRYGSKNTRAYVDGTVVDAVPVVHTAFDESKQRMRALGAVLNMYASDNDDCAPLSDWQGGLSPYVTSQSTFRSPLFEGQPGIGYAMNQNLVGVNLMSIEEFHTFIAFFDTTVLQRNAIALPSSRPQPGRYDGKNTWVHADGSVGSD